MKTIKKSTEVLKATVKGLILLGLTMFALATADEAKFTKAAPFFDINTTQGVDEDVKYNKTVIHLHLRNSNKCVIHIK